MFEHFKFAFQKGFAVIAVEGATLIEANAATYFDDLWVVTLPKEQAFQRVRNRNPNLSDSDIRNRMERQPSDEERLKRATFSYSSMDTFEVNAAKIEERLKYLLNSK